MLKFVLYARANEIRLGEDAQLCRTDFFCVEDRIHISQRFRYQSGAAFPEETWTPPVPCDGSCGPWMERSLDLPEDTLQEINVLLGEEKEP